MHTKGQQQTCHFHRFFIYSFTLTHLLSMERKTYKYLYIYCLLLYLEWIFLYIFKKERFFYYLFTTTTCLIEKKKHTRIIEKWNWLKDIKTLNHKNVWNSHGKGHTCCLVFFFVVVVESYNKITKLCFTSE